MSFAALFRGKYLVLLDTIGKETVRSNAAYGSVMFTFAPAVKFPSVNVTLAFCDRRALCWESLRRYSSVSLFQVRPKAFSNKVQASIGSQIYGSEESTKAGIDVGRRDRKFVELSDIVMDSSCTVRSRMSSESKGNDTPFGIYRHVRH